VIALPTVMTIVALCFSDPVALRWGPWALVVGPVVYVVVKWFGKRAAQS